AGLRQKSDFGRKIARYSHPRDGRSGPRSGGAGWRPRRVRRAGRAVLARGAGAPVWMDEGPDRGGGPGAGDVPAGLAGPGPASRPARLRPLAAVDRRIRRPGMVAEEAVVL